MTKARPVCAAELVQGCAFPLRKSLLDGLQISQKEWDFLKSYIPACLALPHNKHDFSGNIAQILGEYYDKK